MEGTQALADQVIGSEWPTSCQHGGRPGTAVESHQDPEGAVLAPCHPADPCFIWIIPCGPHNTQRGASFYAPDLTEKETEMRSFARMKGWGLDRIQSV